MADCDPFHCPPCNTSSNNCTQRVPTVKLDPTTKLGASCALAGRPTLRDEYPFCCEVIPFNHSE